MMRFPSSPGQAKTVTGISSSARMGSRIVRLSSVPSSKVIEQTPVGGGRR